METELQAADALLNHGVKVRVTAPLLFRVFGKRSISLVIRQPYLGTLYRTSKIYLETGLAKLDLEQLDEANVHELITTYGKPMAKMVAICWLNNQVAGWLLARIVGWWLTWHLTNVQLLTLTQVLTLLSSREAFTSSIRLGSKMRMTQPNLSQPNQGS